ncbi:MAG: GTP-binding protein [Onishia taeanensis]|uniref:CobW family GTP-binding protein n=1 Tax=Halomonadaceae TaxID=28256 RepID=UPI0027155FAC|nr:GTP-binding protein [Halomonas sp. I5-271120]
MHVITGFLGSGKSTLIRHLLAHKPVDERWVVVINEFGQIGIDQAMFDEREDVVVKGLPGGCLCCQLAFVLQASLVNLLHRHRPDRLIIEPSGLGHPAGLLDLLRSDAFAEVLEVRDIIALLDPRRLDDPRSREHETFRDQLEMADGVALTMTDLASDQQSLEAQAYLADLWPAKRWIEAAPHGQLSVSRLLGDPVQRDDPKGAGVTQSTFVNQSTSGSQSAFGSQSTGATVPSRPMPHSRAHEGQVPVTLDTFAYREPAPGSPVCDEGGALGFRSLGWRFHAKEVFSLDMLAQLLESLPAALRIKAVVHTESGWKCYNRAAGRVTLTAASWRRDSRLELIMEAGSQGLPEAASLEASLLACREEGESALNSLR